MPFIALLIMLLLFLKLASEVLKVGTVHENEYKDNHEKDAASQRQGEIIRKL